MSFRLLYVTATKSEADALIRIVSSVNGQSEFSSGGIDISLLVTGAGSVSTVYSLAEYFFTRGKPDLALNGGIAGSYRDDLPPGSVVMPVSDCFADYGVEDDSSFLTFFEAGLGEKNKAPFSEGMLLAPINLIPGAREIARPVKAITVSTATGSENTAGKMAGRYNPDIETMEGAAFFYACAMAKVPFLSFRSVSNMVERRDKSRWNIPLALDNLSIKLNELFTLIPAK